MPGAIDDSIPLPHMVERSSASLGQGGASDAANAELAEPPIRGFCEQLCFEWAPRPAAHPQSEAAKPVEPTAAPEPKRPKPTRHSPAPSTPKSTLRETVRRLLRERQIPYVDVDEAKRAVMLQVKLGSFHFVVYGKNSPNWLLYAAQLRRQMREDLRQWEKVFGEGFIAVVAREKPDQVVEFRTLAGEPVDLA